MPYGRQNALATTSSYSSPYGAGYGSSAYGGGFGGMSGAMSSYNRFGAGGGYGSYGGGGYGGYGGGYGGMGGGYGMNGAYGMGGMPGQEGMGPTFSSTLAESTSPAFHLMESVIHSVSSVAQLLESTYMATHSSFFALASVVDQVGSAKLFLGQILGAFSILRWGREILAYLRGKRSSSSPALLGGAGGWGEEYASLAQVVSPHSRGRPGQPTASPRPSVKPLLFFLLTAVGLPFAMSRVITALARNLPSQSLAGDPASHEVPPEDLTFARAMYRFEPKDALELGLAEGEIVAVLDKLKREGGVEGDWWRGRTRDGRTGWFPRTFVVECVSSISLCALSLNTADMCPSPAPLSQASETSGGRVRRSESPATAVTSILMRMNKQGTAIVPSPVAA